MARSWSCEPPAPPPGPAVYLADHGVPAHRLPAVDDDPPGRRVRDRWREGSGTVRRQPVKATDP
ncbi:MAG: hypothetical protein JF597_24415 [Streptomyces sp.]|uniref:hypothetical protein n=1 Tax=Streptomyces sp. TaxID=1931 RepID=UPI0025DE51EC|nr:hypothetical protein [Streptomyces sp.]MBW8796629.1 hypothetical protein [Streptomyces sp.]